MKSMIKRINEFGFYKYETTYSGNKIVGCKMLKEVTLTYEELCLLVSLPLHPKEVACKREIINKILEIVEEEEND